MTRQSHPGATIWKATPKSVSKDTVNWQRMVFLLVHEWKMYGWSSVQFRKWGKACDNRSHQLSATSTFRTLAVWEKNFGIVDSDCFRTDLLHFIVKIRSPHQEVCCAVAAHKHVIQFLRWEAISCFSQQRRDWDDTAWRRFTNGWFTSTTVFWMYLKNFASWLRKRKLQAPVKRTWWEVSLTHQWFGSWISWSCTDHCPKKVIPNSTLGF